MSSISPGRRLAFGAILALMLYVALEVLVFGGLVALRALRGISYSASFGPKLELSPEQRRSVEEVFELGRGGAVTSQGDRVGVHDPEIGWTIRPNARSPLMEFNGQAIRATREFTLAPRAGFTRIAAIGDSFTMGSTVSNAESWAARLDAMHPEVEVLNFGVGGYGPDQALLRYRRDVVRFSPHVLLIGYMSENLRRTVNVFRPFLFEAGTAATKPRFVLGDDGLELLPNPFPSTDDYRRLLEDEKAVLRELGANDYHYQQRARGGLLELLPSYRLFRMVRRFRFGWYFDIWSFGVYNPGSEALELTARILETSHDEARRNGSAPLIVLYPDRQDIADFRQLGRSKYAPLIDMLEAKELRYVDLIEAFEGPGRGYTAEELCEGHYTALGNEVVATYLSSVLGEQGLLTTGRAGGG